MASEGTGAPSRFLTGNAQTSVAGWSHEVDPVSVAAADLTRADGSPLRVLVVDDEVNIAELISMALRYEGFDVSVAHTGAKAVTTARSVGPDAVVLDIMLPDLDGLEVLRRMRATDPDVPV